MRNESGNQKHHNNSKRWRKLSICLLVWLMSASFAFGQTTNKRQLEPVVQTGHSDIITALAFSPDGKYMASGSKDRTIKIWEVATGVELRTLYGHENTVRKVVFSPDGQTLASAGTGDGTVRLWKVEGGEQWKILKGKTEWRLPDKDISDKVNKDHYESVTSVAFSPDGKIIASCNYKAIKLWDVETGQLLNTLINHTDWIYSIIFNSDGKQIVSAGLDKTIKISDTRTGQVLKVFEDKRLNKEEYYRINSIAFSPDEKTIVSADDEGKIKIWDIKSERKLREFDVDKSLIKPPSNENSNSGEKSEPFQIVIEEENDTHITSVIFLDESTLASGGCGGTITLWDLSYGQKRTLIGHTQCVESVVFSPKNNILASSSDDKTIRFWNIKSGKETKILSGKTSRVSSGVFAHQSPFLAVGFNDSIIKLWNLEKGESKTLDAHAESIPNPKYAFGNGLIQFNYGGLMRVAFSPDDRILATGNRDIKLWETISGKLLRAIPTEDVTVNAFAFSPNGDRLASNSLPTGIIRLWDTNSGKKLKDFTGHESPVDSISFSPNGEILASGSRDKTIKLWDVESGKEIITLTGHDESIVWVVFSSDGEKLVSESEGGTIIVWSIINHQKIASFLTNDPDLRQKLLQIVPKAKDDDATVYGRKFKLNVDGTGSVYISERGSGKLLITLFRLDNEWAVSTPEGFFDGTPNAWKQLIWRFNNNTFDYGSVELYFNDFFYPNLLQDVLAGRSPKPKEGQELEKIDRRQPKVKISSINDQSKEQVNAQSVNHSLTIKRIVTVTVEVTDNSSEKKQPNHNLTSGAQDLRLFRNSSLVKVWHGDVFKLGKSEGCEQINNTNGLNRVRCQTDIPIVAGENNFTAYAFNSSNVKSNDDSVSIKGAESLKKYGTLYVLAVGVNKYANANYDLNFAVPDVQEISTAIKTEQDKLASDAKLKQYTKTEIITLTDENATKENILLALRRFAEGEKAQIPNNASETLKTELAKIKPTQPEDALIIYYAGHGTSQGQRFYLLPHNFTGADQSSLEVQGVSDIELNEVLEKVNAGRLLMAIDACQSGQALGQANEGRAPMNSKGLAQLAYDKGMLILTAAQSQQAALEAVRIGDKEIRHGLLTYALLQGLTSSKADEDSNKQLWEREWLDYAVEQVPLLQMEAMKQRHIEIEKTRRGGELVYVNGDNKSANPDDRKVQTPRVFYRREAELNPMIVAKH